MRRLVLTAVALLLALAAPAFAREEIRSYDSNVTLRADGSVDVVETITVNAEGVEIRHGIYRDIPTALVNADNSRLRSDLNVIAVQRDGRGEPYRIESLGPGFKRIRIGDADTFLDEGIHTYSIHYTMTRMGRSVGDHSELYWNVTGNYWVFPILSATATITLPPGAILSDTVAFTGLPGSKEHAVEINRVSDTTARFRTTRELDPQGSVSEGLSIAVAFQNGILVEPAGLTAAGYWLSDHRELVFPSIAVIILLLYNFFAWSAVGRDPQKGPIIPLFHPPKDLPPALVHYINAMGFKKSGWTAFTASIFDLGVQGLVKIDKAGSTTRISAVDHSKSDLPPSEKGIADFIRARGVVSLDKSDGPALNTQRGAMVSAIDRDNREVWFKNNVPYTLVGVALAALLLGALVWLDVIEPATLVIAVIVAIIAGIFIGVAAGLRSGRGIVGNVIGVIWFVIVGVNVFGSGISLASGIRLDTGLVAAASIIIIEIVFAILMRAPTLAGRKLMDQIDGFKMYLETAEKNRLNYVEKGEPAMSVARFESILPFAIALGVEKPWSQRFEADLARNAVEGVQGGSYSPLWYTGSDWSSSSGGFSNSVSAISAGMSAAMIAAQPSSSSGSGFSGGGGSGGGGGGGGGGGW